jgi:hypothetical protein
MASRRPGTFADVLRAVADLDPSEQSKLSSWLVSLACPGFRVRRRGDRHFVDLGAGRLIPVEGDPDFFAAYKQLARFLIRLQRELWLCPLTAIRQGAEEASQTAIERVRNHLRVVNGRLLHERHRFPRKKSDKQLNEAILRLRDELLPNGKQRSWKLVRVELKAIKNKWKFASNDTVRIRYERLKRKQSPPRS